MVGVDDEYFGGATASVPRVHEQQRLLCGHRYDCAEDVDECLASDGSGFIIVRAADLGTATATH